MIAKGGFVRYAHKNNPMEREKAMVLEREKRISVTGWCLIHKWRAGFGREKEEREVRVTQSRCIDGGRSLRI